MPTPSFRLLRLRNRGHVWAMETGLVSPIGRSKVGRKKDPQRSAVTNGKLLPGIDQRSAWVRRCKDVIAAHVSDLGGADNTSTAERSIIRRAAVLTAQLEQIEAKFALADGVASADDLDLYQRVSSTLRRLLESVGIQRRARDIEEVADPLAYARDAAKRGPVP